MGRSRSKHRAAKRGGAPDDSDLSPRGAKTLAVGYRCNNRCSICLVDGLRNRMSSPAPEDLRRQIRELGHRGNLERLVLSGAECSLEPEFLELVRFASASGCARHIRVQTNGRRFSDREFTRAAIEAGVDEFYVSIRAHEADLDAAVTGRADHFAEQEEGLGNIRELGGTLITCTPVFVSNAPYLEAIARRALRYGPARVEFYQLVPVTPAMEGLLSPLSAVETSLGAALDGVLSAGVEAAATWFPRCWLGRHEDCFVPDLPETSIHPQFWETFPPFGCFYEKVCGHYGRCEGLSNPYIQRFGWEIDRLRPIPRPQEPPAELGDDSAEREESWLALLAGPDGEPLLRTALWQVEGVVREPHRVRFRLAIVSGERFDLKLERRNRSGKPHAQTAGFDLRLVPLEGPEASARLQRRLLGILAPIVDRNDDGRLRLG